MKTTAMEPEKNLHASIPPELLTETETAAHAEDITVDEFVREAVERRLSALRRQRLYAYGEEQARKLGIKEEDVDRIIHEFREEERERQSNEAGR
jgi:hypothetical protein